VDWAISEKSYTQRKACDLVGLAPKVYRYQSVMPDDTGLRQRLRELASQRRRFGYRRLHLLLEREGVRINWKKLYRLYREEKLTVRKRPSRHLQGKCLSGKGWAANGPWEPGHRWPSRKGPTSAGAWTLSRMPSAMGGSSVFYA
jgi:putative transposase